MLNKNKKKVILCSSHQAYKSGAITRKLRALFMSAGLSPPIKISRRRWLPSRRYKKELPVCRRLIRRWEGGSHGYNCFDEKFSPGSRSRRDLFYLRPCKSLTYIISTSPETGVISKDLEGVTEVLPPPSSRPGCKLHSPPFSQIISLWQQQQFDIALVTLSAIIP